MTKTALSARQGFAELRGARNQGMWLLASAFFFSIFVNLLMLTGPLYMLQIYDRVLTSGSVDRLVSLSVLVAGLYLLMAVMDFARGRVMARAGGRFQKALDGRIFETALQKSRNPQEKTASNGALRDLDAMQSAFVSPVTLALFDMPWAPAFLAVIFVFHPMLGWLAVAGGAVICVLAFLNQRLSARNVEAAHKAGQKSQRLADQALDGSEIALSQGIGPNIGQRFLSLRREGLHQTIGANDWTGGFTAFTKAFRLFLQSAMLGLGAFFVIQGELTPGTMIAASILLGRALAPVEQAMGGLPVLQRAWSSWQSLGCFLDGTPDEPQRAPLPKPEVRLICEELVVTPPGRDQPVLRGVTMDLRPGEAVGIVGQSGSGKSSLAKALAGYWPTSGGRLLLGDADFETYNPTQLACHIGYLPQKTILFPGTIAENIARMAINPLAAGVKRAAALANAHDMIMALPDGYQTRIDGNENQLSGGQQQRIALARALYADPLLLILDEPNSMLDEAGTEALNKTIAGFKETGRCVVLMTHRPTAILECDLLLILKEGRSVAFGPRDEIIARSQNKTDPLRQVAGG